MIRRLTVILALMGVAWFVVTRLRNQLFGNAGTGRLPDGAGSASIAQLVRSEPLQPSAPPVASGSPAPSEAEGVTPPHGDPLAQELAEGRDNHAQAATAEGGEHHAEPAAADVTGQGDAETAATEGVNGARSADSEPQSGPGPEQPA